MATTNDNRAPERIWLHPWLEGPQVYSTTPQGDWPEYQRVHQQSDGLARVTEIIQGWASADPDAVDDLDALCRIAEVLDVEVQARST